jgi:hypothetical protein
MEYSLPPHEPLVAKRNKIHKKKAGRKWSCLSFKCLDEIRWLGTGKETGYPRGKEINNSGGNGKPVTSCRGGVYQRSQTGTISGTIHDFQKEKTNPKVS